MPVNNQRQLALFLVDTLGLDTADPVIRQLERVAETVSGLISAIQKRTSGTTLADFTRMNVVLAIRTELEALRREISAQSEWTPTNREILDELWERLGYEDGDLSVEDVLGILRKGDYLKDIASNIVEEWLEEIDSDDFSTDTGPWGEFLRKLSEKARNSPWLFLDLATTGIEFFPEIDKGYLEDEGEDRLKQLADTVVRMVRQIDPLYIPEPPAAEEDESDNRPIIADLSDLLKPK